MIGERIFAEDAIYEPGDGRTHRGRAAIGEALRPQFAGKFSYANYGRRPHVRRDLGAAP